MTLTIDITTARRFVLGKQGLWPGRRWRGLQGAAAAMREMLMNGFANPVEVDLTDQQAMSEGIAD